MNKKCSEKTGFGAKQTRIEIWDNMCLALGKSLNLSISLFICKMATIMPALHSYYEDSLQSRYYV